MCYRGLSIIGHSLPRHLNLFHQRHFNDRTHSFAVSASKTCAIIGPTCAEQRQNNVNLPSQPSIAAGPEDAAVSNEADTCRKYVVPKLEDAGWERAPHAINEQYTFTDGRIVLVGRKPRRLKQKRADYLLRYTRDFPIAVVEAKAEYKLPEDGCREAAEVAW